MDRSRYTALMISGLLLVASPALAVKTEMWTHEQPKDFAEGTLEDVVVSSRGEVMLGRHTETLHEFEERADVVNALARAGDGKVYAATGPNGIIYQIDGESVTEFSTLPEGGTILSLLFDAEGKLLAGTGGGSQAKIYRIDGTGKAEVFHEPEDATYVWAMVRGAEGEIYAATGIEGKIFRISPDGKTGEVIIDLTPTNVLCLAIGPDHLLYAGTDDNGLVYRINPETKSRFVLYDAPQAEISAIVLDATGNVYAATAAAKEAKPGQKIADKPGGKPAAATTPDSSTSEPDAQGEGATTTQPADENGDDQDTADTQPADNVDEPGDGEPEGEPEDSTESASSTPRVSRSVGRPVTPASAKNGGNVIFRIDRNGFVTEVFRESVMILALAEEDGTLYAATGNEGRIYAVTPRAERKVMLAKLDAAQGSALLKLPNGRLMVGTANDPMVVAIAAHYAEKGTLTSPPLDAGQIVKWGRIQWSARVPTGTKLTIATRSSNVEDKESEAWDEWSDEMDATSSRQIPSVTARFLQYRLTFETTLADTTPTLSRVQIARVEENRPPMIGDLVVESAVSLSKKPGTPAKVKAAAGSPGPSSPGLPPPHVNWVVKWKAEDPNKDTLEYDVFYREIGQTRWIRIGKDLKEIFTIWNTLTVADGRYEVRVAASDSKNNAPGTGMTDVRLSDPFVLDNTPPDVTIDALRASGEDAVTLDATLTDALSRIEGASYSVDSDEEWTTLAPQDEIFDAERETISVTIDDLDSGEHRIALRAWDEQGNVRYVTRSTTIGN